MRKHNEFTRKLVGAWCIYDFTKNIATCTTLEYNTDLLHASTTHGWLDAFWGLRRNIEMGPNYFLSNNFFFKVKYTLAFLGQIMQSFQLDLKNFHYFLSIFLYFSSSFLGLVVAHKVIFNVIWAWTINL